MNARELQERVKELEAQNKTILENQNRLGSVMNNYMMLHYLNKNIHECNNSHEMWEAYLYNVTDYGFQYKEAFIYLPNEMGAIDKKLSIVDNELKEEIISTEKIEKFIVISRLTMQATYSDENTFVAMPITNSKDELKLILVVGKDFGMTLEDTELLMIYGQQTIAIVENILLNEKMIQFQALLGEKINDFIMLYHVSQEINTSKGYDLVLENYLKALTSELGFNFENSELFMFEEHKVYEIFLEEDKLEKKECLNIEENVLDVYNSGETYFCEEEFKLFMPLKVLGEILAIIKVHSKNVIDVEKRQLLEVFALQTAGVLYNTRLNYNLEVTVDKLGTEIKERKKAERELQSKTNMVVTLMNNAGQGFLTFDRNFIIDSEYSLECENLFNKKISNINFLDLLFKDNNMMYEELFEKISRGIFEEDFDDKQLLLSLLPESAEFENKALKIEYKYVEFNDVKRIMVILTDVTVNKILEEEKERETKKIKMIIKLIRYQIDFKEVLRNFNIYLKTELAQIVKKGKINQEELKTLYRKIHTSKGEFAQFYLENTVVTLNTIENNLSLQLKKNEKEVSIIKILKIAEIEKNLKKDLNIIRDYLGVEFVSEEKIISIPESNLKKVEKKVTEVLSPEEIRIFIPELKKLRYRELKIMIEPYFDYCYNLAEELGKMMKEVKYEGPSIYIDDNKYGNFVKSLIHIFRNIMDHGIEMPEERLEYDKIEYGSINIKVKKDEQAITMVIKDDGQGIDLEKIKVKLVEKGVFSEKEVSLYSAKKLIDTIFLDSVSSKEKEGILSGRGVGLSAVKAEVENLNGTIEVRSRKGKGTEFKIELPFDKLYKEDSVSNNRFIEVLFEETKNYLKDVIGKDAFLKDESVQSKDIQSFFYSSLLRIKGMNQKEIIISADKDVLMELSKKLLYLEEDEVIDDIEKLDVLAEILNTTIGLSTKQLENEGFENLKYFDTNFFIKGNDFSYVNRNYEYKIYTMITSYGELLLAING